MTTLEAVAFGAMLTWTPSLMILAASLWDVRELEGWNSRRDKPTVYGDFIAAAEAPATHLAALNVDAMESSTLL